jgi:hypothetical protein
LTSTTTIDELQQRVVPAAAATATSDDPHDDAMSTSIDGVTGDIITITIDSSPIDTIAAPSSSASSSLVAISGNPTIAALPSPPPTTTATTTGESSTLGTGLRGAHSDGHKEHTAAETKGSDLFREVDSDHDGLLEPHEISKVYHPTLSLFA